MVRAACVMVWVVGWGSAAADFPAPPRPAEYDVKLFYRASPSVREYSIQFGLIEDELRKLGFVKDAKAKAEERRQRATPGYESLTGRAPARTARQILQVPYVKAIVLRPAGFALPAGATVPIEVTVPETRFQFEFHRQLARLMGEKLGFREYVGYEHRGYRLLVGRVKADAVLDLPDTLHDSVFAEETGVAKDGVPVPLRTKAWPVPAAEVTPEPTAPREPPAEAALPGDGGDGGRKYSAGFRRLFAELKADPKALRRFEVVLSVDPAAVSDAISAAIGETGLIENTLGPVVAVTASPVTAGPALSALREVSVVRLPRPASAPAVTPAALPDADARALAASHAARSHAAGRLGQGVPLAIVAPDFRGYRRFIGKGLPAGTRYLDLTAGTNNNFRPAAFAGDPAAAGVGTRQALAAALAAPRAKLILVRVAADAPYQVRDALEFMAGRESLAPGFNERLSRVGIEIDNLEKEREGLQRRRQDLLNDLDFTPERAGRQKKFEADLVDFRKRYADAVARRERARRFAADVRSLNGVPVVSVGLVWNLGYPADGGSPLSRSLTDDVTDRVLVLPACGDGRGQSWVRRFRELDDNGLMEFAGAAEPLPEDRWTRELNFLGWVPTAAGERSRTIPAGAKVKAVCQWREYRRPGPDLTGGDKFATPMMRFSLAVLRQRDPDGEKIPADRLEVIAGSRRRAFRIGVDPASTVYEQSVEFTAPEDGVYAIQVRAERTDLEPYTLPIDRPAGTFLIRNRGETRLPGTQKLYELRPRFYVESAGGGRAVWLDYATPEGSVGMPADARGALAVGAADAAGVLRPYTTAGGPWNLRRRAKPEVAAPDAFSFSGGVGGGSAVASGFAAGVAACDLTGSPGVRPIYAQWLNRVARTNRPTFATPLTLNPPAVPTPVRLSPAGR